MEAKSGIVLGSRKFSRQAEVTNKNGAQGSVEAFNSATSELIRELAIWVSMTR